MLEGPGGDIVFLDFQVCVQSSQAVEKLNLACNISPCVGIQFYNERKQRRRGYETLSRTTTTKAFIYLILYVV